MHIHAVPIHIYVILGFGRRRIGDVAQMYLTAFVPQHPRDSTYTAWTAKHVYFQSSKWLLDTYKHMAQKKGDGKPSPTFIQ